MDVNDYHIEEDSDDDDVCSSSSEDEIQAFVRENFLTKSDSEDDFETEMEKELSRTVKTFEQNQILQRKGSGENGTTCAGTEVPSKTDVSEREKAGPSNDDLFYDPNLDDEDEQWVNDQRRACIFPSSGPAPSGRERKLPTSDAVLNCPACMTVLCLDCQCHEIYRTQYRAMFVKNCIVDESQVLRCPPSGQKRRRSSTATDDSRDLFNPVRCGVCSTEVAVYDKDQVYHFFNVIASF